MRRYAACIVAAAERACRYSRIASQPRVRACSVSAASRRALRAKYSSRTARERIACCTVDAAATVRASFAHCGGHATLIRASSTVRAEVPVFQPLGAGELALSQRIKHSFDPHRVFNPGRMHADI